MWGLQIYVIWLRASLVQSANWARTMLVLCVISQCKLRAYHNHVSHAYASGNIVNIHAHNCSLNQPYTDHAMPQFIVYITLNYCRITKDGNQH